MREAVVVLAPDVRRQQVVERRDGPAPRDLPGHLQPLRVLVEHRIDDVDEGLVAVEQPVAAGQQVALEPALARVLRQHLHHAAVAAQGDRRSAAGRRPTAGRSPRTPVTAGSTPFRPGPKIRKLSGFWRMTSRSHVPSTFVASDEEVAGLGDLDGVVAEVGQPEVAQQDAAVRMRVGAHPAVTHRRERPQIRSQPARVVEQLLGPIAAEPRRRGAPDAPGSRARRPSGPGATGSCPRPAGRRPPSGPSSPWACAG